MQIVIDIPQKLYKELTTVTVTHAGEIFAQKLIKYIKNGTPLPKGHGRLIDSDILDKRLRYLFNHKGYSKNLIGTGICLAIGENLDMQPIIEADRR